MTKPILTTQQREILQCLIDATKPVSIEALSKYVYRELEATHADGPDFPYEVLRVQIHLMRRALAHVPVRILCLGRGCGTIGYIVEPDHLQAAKRVMAETEAAVLEAARGRRYAHEDRASA